METSEAELFFNVSQLDKAIKAVDKITDPCQRLVWALENLNSMRTFYHVELKLLHGEAIKELELEDAYE